MLSWPKMPNERYLKWKVLETLICLHESIISNYFFQRTIKFLLQLLKCLCSYPNKTTICYKLCTYHRPSLAVQPQDTCMIRPLSPIMADSLTWLLFVNIPTPRVGQHTALLQYQSIASKKHYIVALCIISVYLFLSKI